VRGWNSDQKDTGQTSKCDLASGTRSVMTRDSVKLVFTGQSTEEKAQEWKERLQSAQATDQSGPARSPLDTSRSFPLHKQVKGALSRSRQRQSPGSILSQIFTENWSHLKKRSCGATVRGLARKSGHRGKFSMRRKVSHPLQHVANASLVKYVY